MVVHAAVLEDEAMTLPLMQQYRRSIGKRLAVDHPLIERAMAAEARSENKRNRHIWSVRLRHCVAKCAVIPGELFQSRRPGSRFLWFAALAGVLDHDAHTSVAIIFVCFAQDPHTRLIHCYQRGNGLGQPN